MNFFQKFYSLSSLKISYSDHNLKYRSQDFNFQKKIIHVKRVWTHKPWCLSRARYSATTDTNLSRIYSTSRSNVVFLKAIMIWNCAATSLAGTASLEHTNGTPLRVNSWEAAYKGKLHVNRKNDCFVNYCCNFTLQKDRLLLWNSNSFKLSCFFELDHFLVFYGIYVEKETLYLNIWCHFLSTIALGTDMLMDMRSLGNMSLITFQWVYVSIN